MESRRLEKRQSICVTDLTNSIISCNIKQTPEENIPDSKQHIICIYYISPKQNKNNAGYNTEAAEAETTTIIFSHYMLDKNWAKHSHFYFPLRKFRTKATVVASRKTESSDMKSLFFQRHLPPVLLQQQHRDTASRAAELGRTQVRAGRALEEGPKLTLS